MQEEAEIYEIKSINADGKSVVAYALPEVRRMISRSMAEEYGNVEEKGMAFADVPEGVIPNLK